MAIHEIRSNIFDSPRPVITCPVNTVGVMGAGLARVMRDNVPGLYRYYRHACESGDLKVGKCLVFTPQGTPHRILLFPTKQHWRQPSETLWIELGLEYLAEHLASLEITELAVPPLGCGLGMLDYPRDVRPLLHRHLGSIEDLEVDVCYV